jgi:hypothetical protein
MASSSRHASPCSDGGEEDEDYIHERERKQSMSAREIRRKESYMQR